MRLRLRYSHSLRFFVKLTPKRKADPFCFVEVWGFELQLEEPKSTVLPLYYTSIFLEPLVGIEPTSTDYKSAVITFILKRHSRAAKRNRTSIFSMASWCTNRYTIPANSSFDKHLCQNLEKLTPELYDSWTRAYTVYILCIRLTLLSLKCCTKSAIESKRTQVKPDSYDTKHSADVWSVGARGRRPTDTFTKTLGDSRKRTWCSRAIDEKAQSILDTQYYYGKGYNFLQVLYNLRVWFSTWTSSYDVW